MNNDSLKINQKVDIVVENGYYAGTYLSKISEIKDNCLKVIPPYLRGEIVPLRINQEIKVYFTGNNASYMFISRVLKREMEPVPLYTLTLPGEINRIQRREYFRLDVQIRVKYRLISDEEFEAGSENKNTEKEDRDFEEGITLDISGGGIKMVVDEEFPSEGLIELYLQLPKIKEVVLYGEIVNDYSLTDGRAVGINFIRIGKETREAIISWLFDFQRKLRQKGLL